MDSKRITDRTPWRRLDPRVAAWLDPAWKVFLGALVVASVLGVGSFVALPS